MPFDPIRGMGMGAGTDVNEGGTHPLPAAADHEYPVLLDVVVLSVIDDRDVVDEKDEEGERTPMVVVRHHRCDHPKEVVPLNNCPVEEGSAVACLSDDRRILPLFPDPVVVASHRE
eukprot:CAMPEP_0171048080 /NCGR_PEP_ID=MMETSP0736-20130129/50688_1 /TAXON_ID=186038 /ORGANISM="Fragilariopsis kerguelensis, Strain L26-C5" /LENGTH=115 /DNA_ID=CAMNT_0011499785 /DNA_START=177 /DNA_END=524 /DNA_ORIENTATION=-